MTLDESIRSRTAAVTARYEQLRAERPDSPLTAELGRLLAELERLREERSSTKESGGHKDHPLGEAPFLTTQILFRLDRCEEVLQAPESPNGSRPLRSDPDALIHPTLIATAVRRLCAVILGVRASRQGFPADYNPPGFLEILYLKSPRRLEPLMRGLMRRKRRSWSYYPDRDRDKG